jgi:hypothetical protein
MLVLKNFVSIFSCMKILSYLLAAFIMITSTTYAQDSSMTIPGEYYLTGVMETGAGFKLNSDSTFEFFFSYGALDRYGSGKWTVQDNNVHLISKPKPERDFKLINSKKQGGDFTVKISDKNSIILSFIECSLIKKGNTLQEKTNREGFARFQITNPDSIALRCIASPERRSVFVVTKDINYYEFNLEPWISEYFFDDLILNIKEGGLEGRFPLVDGRVCRFEKAK